MSTDVIHAPKTEELAPYHLFAVSDDLCGGGGRYVYFLERDCAFRIEKVTYDLLEKALEKTGTVPGEVSEANGDGTVPAFSDDHSPPFKGACPAEASTRRRMPQSAGGCGSIFPLEAAADELNLVGEHTREAIAGSLSDAIKLREEGLMRPPVNRLTDEQKERQLEHRFSTPRTSLELALAESCNLACTYCYCSAVRDMPNQGLMSEAVAKKAIEWLFEVSADEKELGITLFGGEPLTNKPVLKFVMDYSDELAKEQGKTIQYKMTTNGTLLDDMVIDYIKMHNFGLMVSLDGPPEIHNAQ